MLRYTPTGMKPSVSCNPTLASLGRVTPHTPPGPLFAQPLEESLVELAAHPSAVVGRGHVHGHVGRPPVGRADRCSRRTRSRPPRRRAPPRARIASESSAIRRPISAALGGTSSNEITRPPRSSRRWPRRPGRHLGVRAGPRHQPARLPPMRVDDSDLERRFERLLRDELTRRSLLRRGAAGAFGASIVAQLAACGDELSKTRSPNDAPRVRKGEISKSMLFSNWPLYIDRKRETLARLRAEVRHAYPLRRGDQRQPAVLRQGPAAVRGGRLRRARPLTWCPTGWPGA